MVRDKHGYGIGAWAHYYANAGNSKECREEAEKAIEELIRRIVREEMAPPAKTEPAGDASGSYMGTGSAHWNPNLGR